MKKFLAINTFVLVVITIHPVQPAVRTVALNSIRVTYEEESGKVQSLMIPFLENLLLKVETDFALFLQKEIQER